MAKTTVAPTSITNAKKTESGWSDVIIQNLWAASSSTIWWTLDVYYQIKQNNDTGISDIYIIGVDFDETNCQNSGDYSNGTLTVDVRYNAASKNGTLTHKGTTEKLGRWTILLDLTLQVEHEYDGSGILALQWKANHTGDSSSNVPRITEWQTTNITLPALDPRIINFTTAINYIGTTSISYKITVNKAISQISMSLDNITWNTTDQQITNSRGGSFDKVITGLTSGTNYRQYIKVKTSSDGSWSDIGSIAFTTTKYFPANLK